MKKANGRYLSLALILLSAVCAAAFWLSAGLPAESDPIQTLPDGWYTVAANGDKQMVTLPATLTAGEELTLCCDAADAALFAPGRVVATNAAVYDVALYWNDALLYQFDDGGLEINIPVRSNIVCAGTIPAAQGKNTLKIVYHSAEGVYRLPEVTVSTEKALVFGMMGRYAPGLLVSFAMVIVGVFSIVLSVVLRWQKQNGARVLCIGWSLILCGLWCVSDSPFTLLYCGYCKQILYLDFYLFMLMPIPLFYFVLNSGEMKKHRLFASAVNLYYLNIVLQSVFAGLGIFGFFRMLFVSHLLMIIVGVGLSLFMLLWEYRKTRHHDILFCLRALSAVGVIGVFAILLYVVFNFAAYQLVFQTGLLLLMVVLLSALLKEFVESVKNRTEALVYKQLSEQDKLTKLENRRAYDRMIEKMESGALQYRNAALLFLDVNYLKQANDTYGHEAGDQLLLEAAECIQSSFGAAGYCYRVGGDEFCAILFDPTSTAEELVQRIRTEEAKINRREGTVYPLSIACGCCFMVEDGTAKTIPQWKAAADERMYENKREIKAAKQAGVTG